MASPHIVLYQLSTSWTGMGAWQPVTISKVDAGPQRLAVHDSGFHIAVDVQARVTKQLKEAREQWRAAKEESQAVQRQLDTLTAQVMAC